MEKGPALSPERLEHFRKLHHEEGAFVEADKGTPDRFSGFIQDIYRDYQLRETLGDELALSKRAGYLVEKETRDWSSDQRELLRISVAVLERAIDAENAFFLDEPALLSLENRSSVDDLVLALDSKYQVLLVNNPEEKAAASEMRGDLSAYVAKASVGPLAQPIPLVIANIAKQIDFFNLDAALNRSDTQAKKQEILGGWRVVTSILLTKKLQVAANIPRSRGGVGDQFPDFETGRKLGKTTGEMLRELGGF